MTAKHKGTLGITQCCGKGRLIARREVTNRGIKTVRVKCLRCGFGGLFEGNAYTWFADKYFQDAKATTMTTKNLLFTLTAWLLGRQR